MGNYYFIDSSSSGEFYHHGIKGMKWGVRRFQKKDGSLTSAGRKRYDNNSSVDTSHKSKRRLKLEEKYRSQGMSEKNAELAAKRRVKAEKLLAVVGGATVAAVAIYAANKYVKDRTDQIIKSGHLFQRIEMQNTGGKVYDKFYAAANKHDNARYKAILGKARATQTGEAYIMRLSAKKDIKVASKKNAQNVYEELMKNDSNFKSLVRTQLGVGQNTNKTLEYEQFNRMLVGANKIGGSTIEKFYGALRDKGYGAIQDINDMKYSGYKAKNPLIIFDAKDNVMVKSFKELDANEVAKTYGKEYAKMFFENSVPDMAKMAGYGSLIGVTNYGINTAAINNYRKEHPNTELSDKEISKILKERNN